MSCYRFTIGWPGLILLLIWAGGNIALFWFTFASYMWNAEYMYIFKLLGLSLSFSRGAAQALNFNCALILLPVCRNLISLLRRCFGFNHEQCFGPKAVCRQLDRNIFFHKIVAYSICFWTAIHYIGHCFNVERFVSAAKARQDVQEHQISKLPHRLNGTWVNPIRRNETFPVFELITMIPGWSGLIALTVLIVMVSASTETIRRKFHEVFWYTHHLFVLFYIFIIVHGFGGIIRGQTNLKNHDPKQCHNKTQVWGVDEECPWPEFSAHEADTWMWVTGPLILYGIENIIKLVNRFRKVEIVEAIIHPSDVLELKMKKTGFRSNAGQYITIMCPSLSYLQWHPFTLTSAPGDDFFSVHIRVVGDWTKHLCSLVKDINAKKAQNNQISYPRVAVDGPFGTCCEDVFRYNVVMLIGAGIGVTPFASILKHIWYLYKEKKELHVLKKVHFHWICRDKAFRWFNEMLKQLEERVQETENESFMSINIHLTRGWDNDIQKQVIETISEPVDCLTELTHKTKFGRPNWEKIFKDAASEHPNEEVGVFYCGPKELTKPLRFHCGKNSNLIPHGRPRFVFHKENF